jgi:hypothetical protein
VEACIDMVSIHLYASDPTTPILGTSGLRSTRKKKQASERSNRYTPHCPKAASPNASIVILRQTIQKLEARLQIVHPF